MRPRAWPVQAGITPPGGHPSEYGPPTDAFPGDGDHAHALRAATATPARRFGLTDRGRITPGARADLLLVDSDPTTTIADTLSIRAVWRRGVRQTPA